jgi:hypothetical protein
VGIVVGGSISGLFFLAGLATGLRLLVVANGLSFVCAFGPIFAAFEVDGWPAWTTSAEGGPTGSYRPVLADRVNLTLASLNILATLLMIIPILMLPVVILEDLHLPTWLPGVLAALLTGTAAIGLAALIAFTRNQPALHQVPLDTWQYLHSATYDITDPDGTLAGAVIDNPEVDPFIGGCPNDAAHEVLGNTLVYNGTVLPHTG